MWWENRNIVEVFTSCRWRTQVLMGAEQSVRLYEGIDAAEVAHCCDLLQVPPATRRDVLWGVRVMEHVAMPILNEQR